MSKEWIKTVKSEVPLKMMLEGAWKNKCYGIGGWTKRSFVVTSMNSEYVESQEWFLERTSEINYRECNQFKWPDYWRVQQDVPQDEQNVE